MLLTSLFALYQAYSCGAEFGYSFDDEINLSGLTGVTDLHSALLFVFSGQSGPSGRPLALASFLINQPSWPSNHVDFLRTNVLIHLLNAALVAWFALRLARYLPWEIRRPEWFALTVGVVWASHPILISTNLMIVQRMTSLSATFCLLGLIAFVIGRQSLEVRNSRAIALMSLGIGGGTILAFLCKESGVLLPLFALVTEVTLISASSGKAASPGLQLPRWWAAAFLKLPAFLIATYLMYIAIKSGGIYAGRSFDLWERLLTESRIVLTYLKLIVFPVRSEIGPFHDDFQISQGLIDPPATSMAIAGWLLMTVASLRCIRTRWAIVSFAFAWFVAGHLIESTVVGLELYFEHRNYMPSIGIVFSLVALLWSPLLKLIPRLVIFSVLISNQWFVFKEAITVWGSPQLAAQLWHRERPGSLRALQAHAADLRMKGDIRGIVKLVDGAPFDLLNRADFQVFKLKIYCQLMPEDAISKMLPEVVVALKTDAISAAAARELININDLGKEKKCAGLAEQTYLEMLNLVASASDRAGGGARSFAHDELANYWINCRVIDKAMYHLEQAQRLQPSLNLVAKMVTVLTSAGLVDQAQAVLRDSRNQMPMRPFVYDAWEKVFDQLEATLDRASAQQSIYARPQ